MANYTFFTHPMSRSQIARWALHEVGADYQDALVDFSDKPEALLKVNPMGKVPTLVHHASSGDRVVSEAAAICAYLAEMHPDSGLLPGDEQKADYLRWMFFAAGPVDQAITAKALEFDPVEPQQKAMAGWGNFERTMTTLEWWLADRAYVCGSKFTAVDIYLGSLVDWGLNFGTIPPKEAFVAYAEQIQQRPAYKEAKKIDTELFEKMQK